MATLFTIEGTTTQGTLAKNALCSNYGYKSIIDGVANPESETAFAKRMVNEFLISNIKKYRIDQFELGRADAETNAETEANGIIVN